MSNFYLLKVEREEGSAQCCSGSPILAGIIPLHSASSEKLDNEEILMYSWFERTINGLRTGTDCSFVNPHNPCDIRWIWLYCQSLAETGFARLSRTKWRTIEHPTLGLVQWRMCVDRFGDTSFKLKVGGEMVIRTVKGGDGRTYAKWSICGWHLSDPMVVDAYDDFLGTIEDGSLLPRPKDFHTA